MKKQVLTAVCMMIAVGWFGIAAAAGDSGDPMDGSDMPTLEEVYNYLLNGTEETPNASFEEPATGPGPVMRTTREIYDDIRAEFRQCVDAAPDRVLRGVTFFSTDPDNWGPVTGTMAERGDVTGTDGQLAIPIPDGHYEGRRATASDTDLTAANIRDGVSIFGVQGAAPGPSGDAVAADVRMGKTFSNASDTGMSGTMAAQSLSPETRDVSAGYYEATTLNAVDADLAPGNVVAGKVIFGVTGTADVATGDAAAADVLSGKAFSNADEAGLIGTMANVGRQSITPETTAQAITQGYHAGTGQVAGDANLVSGNIRAGVTIFGVSGKTEVVDTTAGDAFAGDMKAGKRAYVDGVEVTGTIVTQTLSDANRTVSEGFYRTTTLEAVDPDLATGNIRASATIFGVSGKTEVVDTSSGNAVAGDMRVGKKAYVDGVEVTGTIVTQTLSPANTTVSAGYYDATTLDAVDSDLVSANIRADVTLFGVPGDSKVVDTRSGDAIAGDMKSGKKAWVDGAEITGTIATRTLSDADTTVIAGYYEETTLEAADADLSPGNVVAGKVIFGVTGMADLATGNAVAADVLDGRTFSNADGTGMTGTMPAQSLSPETKEVSAGYYEATTLDAVDADLAPGNVVAGKVIFGVTGTVDVAIGNAVAADVLDGRTFSNADGTGMIGSMINVGKQDIAPGTTDQPLTQGYHDGTGQVRGDVNLTAENIRDTVTIFDVTGNYTASAAIFNTGQTGCWDDDGNSRTCSGTGEDGERQAEADLPSPRFTPNGDGTVTDNLTGLMWLQDANFAGTVGHDPDGVGPGEMYWQSALDFVRELNNGDFDATAPGKCGHDDWHLPNVKELQSLIHFGYSAPSFSNDAGTGHWTSDDSGGASAFSNVESFYWSGTSFSLSPSNAWKVSLGDGNVSHVNKTSSECHAWPVRAGE